jgi:hypothetical protein
MSERGFDVHVAAREAWSVFDEALTQLVMVSDAVLRRAETTLENSDSLLSDDLQPVKADVMNALVQLRPPVIGLGVVIDVDVLRDAEYWMVWLERQGANIHDSGHDLDPASPDFYDYALSDWMSDSSRERAQVHGPFIDIKGTGDFTITISTPIRFGDQFLGVAAADISLEDYERFLVGTLHAAEGSIAVLSSENRVVASNDAARPVGTILNVRDETLVPCGPLGWTILYTE